MARKKKNRANSGTGSSSSLPLSPNNSQHLIVNVDTPSPFGISVNTLMELIDPKNPEKLAELGGVDGIAKSLFADLSQGLTTNFVAKPSIADRQIFFGKNVIPQSPPASFFSLVCEAFKDKTLILLSVAAIVSLGIGIYKDVSNAHPGEAKVGWIEGFAIMVAVVIVVLVGSVNDYQKEKQFRKLNSKKEDRLIKVIREGQSVQLSIFDTVVGDVVILEPGEVLPADGLVIEGHNLSCDESGATGESKVIKKGRDENDPFLLSGTKVTEGVGKMLVIAVGPSSFNGKTLLSLQVESSETPLEIKLDHLAESIAKLGAAIALLMLISLIIKFVTIHSINSNFPDAAGILSKIVNIFIQAITIVVVAVPEGLPMAVTLALAFATTRMLQDNNLVRVLSACETMGNATTICSDKTGTLTENKMTVVQGNIANVKFEVELEIGSLSTKLSNHVFDLLCNGIAINSSAFESKDPESGKMTFVGSHTEIALINFMKKLGGDFEALRKNAQVADLFPFSSQRKSMASIVKTNVGYRIYSKGASEIILGYCSKYIDADGNERDLDSYAKEAVNRTICGLASEALRTIGLAYRNITQTAYEQIDKSNPPDSDLVLIGIVGIEDPLREGVKEAVSTCQKAGIFVRMVTGDNILTAQSIAKKCGILMKGGAIMEGPRFRKLSEDALTEMVPRLQVLARSSPLDKQILVRKLKEMGEVVAVTGDGTNDGPALKAADVGFSMGITGTEVAKEASSIILMDDNFTSIVKAVSWGRCVNDSVRKFLQFQLTVNVTAVIVAFVSSMIDENDASVLTAVQLLWVNLIMDTLAALALATEKPTPELLKRYPERKDSPLITFHMWRMIIGQAIFQIAINLVLFRLGDSIFKLNMEVPNQRLILRTTVFNTFVFMQLANELNCRFLKTELNIFKGLSKNPIFLIIMALTIALQLIIVEFGGVAFGTTGLPWHLWLISVGIGLLSIPVAIIIRLLPDWRSPVEEPKPFVSKPRLAWQAAIHEVRTELQVFSALRRFKRPPPNSRSQSMISVEE